MAGVVSSQLSLQTSLVVSHQKLIIPTFKLNFFILTTEKRVLLRCNMAKKKITLADQILDYIEGGPKLRKWYGAPDLLPEDGSVIEDEEEDDDQVRDAVLVTDGDSEMGQMIILSLIIKRTRIKALVKDKRAALDAFGTYVESMAGDMKDNQFLKRALRGVRTVISPNEGFLSKIGSLKGVQHIIILSQLSVYKGAGGIQALMKSNAKKLAEQDELILMASGIPYTVIRAGLLKNAPGGKQGFRFDEGCAVKGTLNKEDAAFICAEAIDAIPPKGFTFEVVNGEEQVSDWKDRLARLMDKAEDQLP